MATRTEWEKRVKRWQRSGLDADQFARREGLEVKQLRWWRWKLGSSAPPTSAESRLMPSHAGAPSPSPDPLPAASPAPPWVDIALPNGDLVRLLPGVDPATLACVLAVVAELSR